MLPALQQIINPLLEIAAGATENIPIASNLMRGMLKMLPQQQNLSFGIKQRGFGNTNVQPDSNVNPEPNMLRQIKSVASGAFGDQSLLHDLFGMRRTYSGTPDSMRRSEAEDCVDEQVR